VTAPADVDCGVAHGAVDYVMSAVRMSVRTPLLTTHNPAPVRKPNSATRPFDLRSGWIPLVAILQEAEADWPYC
jgi:hypothetical protein